jgi:hypothetical protein
MSGDEPQYKSRLQKQGAPMRGLGAGYATNQQLAGVENPAEAARMAAMSPEDAEDERQRLERLESDADAMREDLLIAIIDKSWTPTGSVPWSPDASAEKVKDSLRKMSVASIAEMHKEMNAAVEAAIDAESEADIVANLRSEMGIQPDDPLYDPLMDRNRRKALEEKLKPMSFEDMVFHGSTTQDIPLRDDFSITFRTLSTTHSLWLEYFASQLPETSNQHLRHTFSLMQVAACLDKLNGRDFDPELKHLTKDDEASRKAFKGALDQRMNRLGQFPTAFTDDLIVQYGWFTGRVRKLLAGDTLRKVGNS